MRKILGLTTVLFLLLACSSAFATTDETLTTQQIQNIKVEYVYNPFGVALSSTEITRIETTTTKKVDGKTQTSTTITESTAYSVWKGGSLKIDKVEGTSNTTSDDGTVSESTFSTVYEYNDKGQLIGAKGEGSTTTTKTKDGKIESSSTSTTVDTYEIRDGVALKVKSVTTGVSYGPGDTDDREKKADNTTTVTYEYEMRSGSWVVTKEIEYSETLQTDKTKIEITKTKVYTRDENGVITGITMTATGKQGQVTGSSNGEISKIIFNMKDYEAEFTFDSEVGWYLTKESFEWHWTGQYPD